MNDLLFGLRVLLRNPGFTAVAILTLALGIGANTAIFSIINDTFLRALPYPEPDQLMHLAERSAADDNIPISYPNFLDWHRQQSVFSGLAVHYRTESKLKTELGAEMVNVQHVSADFLSVLHVQLVQGRGMLPEDDVPGAKRAAWVSHDAWRRLFNGDSNLVGRSFILDGQPLTIAGILPASFRFYGGGDLITAIAPFAREFFLDMRENRSPLEAVARLKPGVSIAIARAQMNTIAQRLAQEHPEANKNIGIAITPLREQLSSGMRSRIILLFGAVTLVLLIACVNVASMLLARSLARAREMAIRTALGASSWRLIRQLILESLLLAAAGGLAGAFIGFWGYEFARRLVPFSVQRVIDGTDLDQRMFLFLAAITLITGVAFGMVPAWQLSRIQPVEALKQTTRNIRTVFGRIRSRDVLVVGQVAFAMVLLVAAGLMIRSLHGLLQVDTGYESSRVLTLEATSPPGQQFQNDPGSFTRHYERLLEPVQHLAGVEAAAVASGLPFTWSKNSMTFYRQDLPVPAAGEFPAASQHTVSPDYFRVMGISLLRGRGFDGTERGPVIPPGMEMTPQNLAAIFKGVTFSGVISQNMANRFWPGEDPIGKRFRLGFPSLGLPWVEIIGVAGNTVQTGLDQGEAFEFYLPLRQWPVPINLHLVLRTRAEPRAIIEPVKTAIASVARDEAIRDIRVMAERIDSSTADRRFNRNLFASFAVTALVLVMIGLYGVLAFHVGRCTREIGIRMALGARRRDVINDVLARGLYLVLPGILLGLCGAWGVSRLLQSQLYGVSGADPLTYFTGALLLLAVALIACLIPAWRASRVHPMVALREE
jgi:putative ABC transport system permease protein